GRARRPAATSRATPAPVPAFGRSAPVSTVLSLTPLSPPPRALIPPHRRRSPPRPYLDLPRRRLPHRMGRGPTATPLRRRDRRRRRSRRLRPRRRRVRHRTATD